MDTKPRVVSLLAAFFVLSLSVPSACGWCCVGTHSCRGYFHGYAPPGLYHERPPYFSYFVPVYYMPHYVTSYRSVIVSRQPSEGVAPLRITNPFVTPKVREGAARDKSTARPLRIRNPYVDSELASAR